MPQLSDFSIAEGYADNELWEMEDCLITQD